MGSRAWATMGVLALVALGGIAATQLPGPAAIAPSVLLVACLASVLMRWTRTWGAVAAVSVLGCELSLVASIISFRATGHHLPAQTEIAQQIAFVCLVVNELALMVLIALVVRTATTAKRAAAVVAPASVVLVLWALPFIKPITTENALFAVLTVMVLRVLVAVGVGVHLRSVDALRIRAVADARRAQRLDLARDLHDFVAHDVSGIVAQAQAAQLVAADDPGASLAALGRIEQAGLKALACMDNTVHMLHDTDAAEQATTCTPLPGLADLPRLADQFSATSPARVALRIHPAALETTPREVATTAYRVVVETLTNIRRHASTADTVEIVVTDDPDPIRPALRVMVTNDSAGAPARSFTRTRRRGGLGLLGLTDRVHALGGNLHAGPHGTAGWRVTAVLPLAGRAGLSS